VVVVVVIVEAALNGARGRDEHPRIPRTPSELSEASSDAVTAGAGVLHFHVFDDAGNETFDAVSTSSALRAVRAACPDIPLSLSTSEGIEPDPARRLQLVAEWDELPDLVTANMGEAGIRELCEHLIGRRVAIEAGVLSLGDAHAFVQSGLVRSCVRVLIEPLDADPDDAVEHASIIEDMIVSAGIALEQVHHGDGIASWAVNKRALERGHGIRTGLEDTTVLPDGTVATDNAELVSCAVAMIQGSAGAGPKRR
jgi:uncharacterized protein (DUF849 family)